MSGVWSFYPCWFGDEPASIYLDLGIAKDAPMAQFPVMAYLRVYMNSPQPNGLSSQEEFQALMDLEDRIEEELASEETAVYVGRRTYAGCRDFYFYTSDPQDWQDAAGAVMKKAPEYRFECATKEDTGWAFYLECLYPSEPVWQDMIDRSIREGRDSPKESDLQLLRITQGMGDSLEKEREIDHWIYFDDPRARKAFEDEAAALGFRTRCQIEPDEEHTKYGIQVYRVDVPSAIGAATRPLSLLAAKLHGEYDGWEGPVLT